MPNVRLNLLRQNYLTDLRERSLIHLYLSFLDSFFTGNYWTSSSDAESPWTRSLDGLPLSTLREIEAFVKDSGKTAKLNKRTEQLLNDNFHDNISCLNEGNFFMFEPFVEQTTERKIPNYALLLKSHLQLLNMRTVHVELAKVVGVIMFMH